MSAQSANKTAKDTDLKAKTEKPVETRSVPSHKKASSSQPVESIVVGSGESPIPVVPTVVAKVPPYSQSDPTQVYQQAYQQAVQYQAAGFAAPQVQGQPVYLYQTPAGLVQLPQMAVSSLNQPVKAEPSRSNLKVIPTTAADKNEKPEKVKSSKELESEKKFRKQRLNYLEEELNKLRKQQTDLIQRKRKQKGDHELMNQNTILQAGVERQIKEIRGSSETQSEVR
uniref:Uncharacterized protein n=1 Tax=Ciona savignyi TaxID=51511 RepID=H2YZQ6_CIOSA